MVGSYSGNQKADARSVTNPFKFAGGYLDASGYEQFGVRYYSPLLGRWTQQDPLAGSLFDLNSANRYVYAGDDPVNQVDPNGKNCGGAIIDAIVSVLSVSTLAAVVYNAVIPAILAATFFPPSVLGIIATVTAIAIYAGTAYEILKAIDMALPQCGINFSLGY